MNWQNIPRDDKTIKRAVIPKQGSFSFFDYSQIEPRLFGYYVAKGLGDPTIADWYREGRDFYTEIAAQLFDKPESEITPEERQIGKNQLFLPILYSAGPKRIAADNDIPLTRAREMYNQFHANIPWVRSLSNPAPSRPNPNYTPGLIERTLRKRGFLKTLHGRHLHPPQYGEHKMLNTLIQGSAADLMKASLLRVDDWVREVGIESRMVSVIHDEIIFDGPESEIPVLNEHVPALMREERITDVIPIEIDHEVSLTSWAEKVTYEEWKEIK